MAEMTTIDASQSDPTNHIESGSNEEPKQLKNWQKPGLWGSTLRCLRNIQRYVWDDPDKPAIERKFLFKLDIFLLTYACYGYFCKNLVQSNINNAYVSGMKEDLNMSGSELSYLSNVFTAGYVVGQFPAIILVTRLRPSRLVPTLEILWSVVTFCCAAAKNVKQLYALRFLLGLFEGAFFPCIIYIIGSWYTKNERAKRTVLFYSTTSFAAMFSGYLQVGAYDGLNGHLGQAGWQWLFIICGIISLPGGILGYFFNPDFPENTRAFYITKTEAEWARQRLLNDGYKALGASAWDRKKIFRIMGLWQFWLLPIGYFFIQASFPTQQPAFSLYLKAENYSVYDINVWPTGQPAIGAVSQIIAGMIADSPLLNGHCGEAILVMQAGTFFSCVVLAIWDVPERLKLAAYYLSYMSSGVPGIYYSWFPDLIPSDHETRGFLIAAANILSYVNIIWYTDAVWRTVESPMFRQGFIAAAAFGIAISLHVVLITWLQKLDQRKISRAVESDVEVNNSGEVIELGNEKQIKVGQDQGLEI